MNFESTPYTSRHLADQRTHYETLKQIRYHNSSTTQQQLKFAVEFLQKYILNDQFGHIPEGSLDEQGKAVMSMYQMADSISVNWFVANHSYLIPLLKKVPSEIGKYFPSAGIKLELFSDPEDGTQTLALVVSTGLNASEARKKLDAFNDEWWRDRSYELDPEGKLLLDIEFR